MSEEEIAKLWSYWEEERTIPTAALRVLLLTGQRMREVLEMHRDELQGDGWWVLPGARSKNHLAHAIWLSTQARAVMDEVMPLAAQFGPYVFPGATHGGTITGKPLGNLYWASQCSMKATGVVGWTRHDLRRTFATGLAKLGVRERVISLCLNHRPGSVTGRHYNHWSYKEEKAAAWQKWADYLDRIVGRGGSVVVPFTG